MNIKWMGMAISRGAVLLCLQHLSAQSPAEIRSPRPVPVIAQAFLVKVPAPAGVASTETARSRWIESAIDGQLSAVASVICHERTSRYTTKGKATRRMDTLDVNVSVLNGLERYSEIWSEGKTFRAMEDIPGTWSAGEIITLLSVIREALRAGTVRMEQDEQTGRRHPILMTFSDPASSRHWSINVDSQKYWMSFEAQVWVSPETGEILRVSWRASDPPAAAGVSEFLWTVDFSPVKLAAQVLTLPREASFASGFFTRQPESTGQKCNAFFGIPALHLRHDYSFRKIESG